MRGGPRPKEKGIRCRRRRSRLDTVRRDRQRRHVTPGALLPPRRQIVSCGRCDWLRLHAVYMSVTRRLHVSYMPLAGLVCRVHVGYTLAGHVCRRPALALSPFWRLSRPPLGRNALFRRRATLPHHPSHGCPRSLRTAHIAIPNGLAPPPARSYYGVLRAPAGEGSSYHIREIEFCGRRVHGVQGEGRRGEERGEACKGTQRGVGKKED